MAAVLLIRGTGDIMPVDPNIALSFRQPEIESPLNNFAKVMAIQAAGNQNALAQYQLSSAQRNDEVQNSLLRDLRAAGPDQSKQEQAYINAGKVGDWAKIQKERADITNVQTTTAKNQQEVRSQALRDMAANPTDDNLKATAQHLVNQGIFKPQDASDFLQEMLPLTAPQRVAHWAQQGLSAKDLHEITTSKPIPQTDGQTKWYVEGNPSLSTFGQKLTAMAPVQEQLTPDQAANLPIKQQTANAATMRGTAAMSQADTSRAGLGLRAIQVDPLGISGAQDAYPLLPNTASGKTASIAPGATFTPQDIAAIQADAAKNAAPAPPAGTQTLGGTMTLRQGAASGLRGNEFLATMPPLLAGQVAAIADHRAAPPLRNTPRGDALMQLVQQVDPTYDATSYNTKQGIEKAFASGRAGDTVRSFGVVQNHIDTLRQTADALANGDLQIFNKVGNMIAQWTGQPAPTDFNAVKRIVAGELTKAVIGAAGALGDRNAVDQALSAANSPAQLKGVLDRYQQLIRGQVDGYRQQYKAGGGAKDFDRDIMGIKSATAALATGEWSVVK